MYGSGQPYMGVCVWVQVGGFACGCGCGWVSVCGGGGRGGVRMCVRVHVRLLGCVCVCAFACRVELMSSNDHKIELLIVHSC